MSGGYRKKTLKNSTRFLSGPPIAQKKLIFVEATKLTITPS